MRTARLLSAAYGALALVDTVLAGRPGGAAARRVTKPLLMPTLAAGLLATRPGGEGCPGDAGRRGVLLGRRRGPAGKGRRPFLTGVASFFGAHVAYVVAFRARSLRPAARLARPAAFSW